MGQRTVDQIGQALWIEMEPKSVGDNPGNGDRNCEARCGRQRNLGYSNLIAGSQTCLQSSEDFGIAVAAWS